MDELSTARAERIALVCNDLRGPLAALVQNAEHLFVMLVDEGLDNEATAAAKILEKATMAKTMVQSLEQTAGLDRPRLDLPALDLSQASAGSRLAGLIEEWPELMNELELLEFAPRQ